MPVTAILKVQEPPAASDPPVNAIVRVAAVVVNVPPHWDVDEVAMDRPDGRTSVNATLVNARFPEDVLFSVKLNVDVEPLIMGLGEKDFAIVGAGAGIPQPVNVMLSINKSAPVLSLFAPVAVIFTQTVLFCGILSEYGGVAVKVAFNADVVVPL